MTLYSDINVLSTYFVWLSVYLQNKNEKNTIFVQAHTFIILILELETQIICLNKLSALSQCFILKLLLADGKKIDSNITSIYSIESKRLVCHQ